MSALMKLIPFLYHSRFPLMTNFRPSAHQALQKAFKRGRLQKVGNKYRLNPNWSGGSVRKFLSFPRRERAQNLSGSPRLLVGPLGVLKLLEELRHLLSRFPPASPVYQGLGQ